MKFRVLYKVRKNRPESEDVTMKKNLNTKVLSLLLVAVMMLSIVPFSSLGEVFVTTANAFKEGYYTYIVENDEATITEADKSINGEIIIPSTLGGYPVTSIGEGAFFECNRITRLTIPNSVTVIDIFAFADCKKLTKVNIPNSVTSIETGAFWKCTSLKNITLPNSITSIGEWAFDETGYYKNESNWENSGLYIDNYLVSTGYYRIIGEYTIKEGTILISDGGFYNCDEMTKVNIPNSVKYIGTDVFYFCDALTSIEVADDNPNYSSKDGVLFSKDRTQLIQYPIGSTKADYEIPNNVTDIGRHAFAGCEHLEIMNIPDNVTSIGYGAFKLTSNLEDITISDSVTSIGNSAFTFSGYYEDESNWENHALHIGNHLVETIGIIGDYPIKKETKVIADSAFEACYEISSVTVPNSVTHIGNGAFYECGGITDVYFGGTQEEWNNITIGKDNEDFTNATLHFVDYFTAKFPEPASYNNFARYNNYVNVTITVSDIPPQGILVVDGNRVEPDADGTAIYKTKIQVKETKTFRAYIADRDRNFKVAVNDYNIFVMTGFFEMIRSFFLDFLFNGFKWREITVKF